MKCPDCCFVNPDGFKYCGDCGCHLTPAESDPPPPLAAGAAGERKHATVLFSDLSGYTAMTERLDPEEVKALMGRIFTQAGKIVEKYAGTVERFFGDEIMALFGVPRSHEDDPVRAVRAAMEIHAMVAELGDKFESRLGKRLSMHSGVNTGLVVTGDEYIGKGRHGLTGDTINLAKRLTGLAGEGEIFIGPETHFQAAAFFTVEEKPPTSVKGKAEPVNVHKILGAKDRPEKLHRILVVRARLIGRDREMALLESAVADLRKGEGAVVAVSGDAGTGKSRLAREFRGRLDPDEIRWHEGHAYGYTQNMPYYPLVDMLTHAFRIDEGDAPEQMRTKIESGLAALLGPDDTSAPYIGGLFSIEYAKTAEMSPEFWQAGLFDAVRRILSALIEQGPTVICFEDLHWADPSFVDMLRKLLADFAPSALFVCLFRPPFSLFGEPGAPEGLSLVEIPLRELAEIDTEAMLCALLETETAPPELLSFVRGRAEGNPFYLEELVNTLIDNGILARNNGSWLVAREIIEADVPASIQGVLASRIDRLDVRAKRVLQEASVIGRAFMYEILKKVTDIKAPIDQYLAGLEELDLIRARTLAPDLEYIFKHVLTQEVVYNGLLKKERQEMHERIGLAMEQIFSSRLPEFYETLALHFMNGTSALKAVDYLSKAGEKSMRRYALEEAHRYYRLAYNCIRAHDEKDAAVNEILVDVILKWAMVYYYTGEWNLFDDLLSENAHVAESLEDVEKKGMYRAWKAFVLFSEGRNMEAYDILIDVNRLGEKIGSLSLMGYTYSWLAYVCGELGRFQEGIECGRKGNEIAVRIGSDHYLYFKSLSGVSWNHFMRGCTDECRENEDTLIAYSKRHSQARGLTLAYSLMRGAGQLVAGDLAAANKTFSDIRSTPVDPWYLVMIKLFQAHCAATDKRFEEAEPLCDQTIRVAEASGGRQIGSTAEFIRGICRVDRGEMSAGMKEMLFTLDEADKMNRRGMLMIFGLAMGRLYLEIVRGSRPVRFMEVVKNIGFVLNHALFAAKHAERWLKSTLADAVQLDAPGMEAQSRLELGALYALKKRNKAAREHLEAAVPIFRRIGAHVYLKQAEDALAALSRPDAP